MSICPLFEKRAKPKNRLQRVTFLALHDYLGLSEELINPNAMSSLKRSNSRFIPIFVDFPKFTDFPNFVDFPNFAIFLKYA